MASAAPHGHLARYREVATVLAEEGLGAVAVRMGLPGALRGARELERDATTPERLRRSLERLGPAAVKVGQMLSTRPDLLPEEYRVELRRLQDHVSPISYDLVAEVIRVELGGLPEEVFEHFEHEPWASASIGQVHAARLPGGAEVVVKVQRPGVIPTVETDLDIMLTQARRIDASGVVSDGIDVLGVAEEFARAVRAELDYLTEADNVERFSAIFADSEEVRIPHVFRDFTSRRVLTLERLYGIPFNRPDLLDEAHIDRHDLANRGVCAYLEQIFEFGVFHADPHPGNLFALPDNRVGFTDFGRVGTVSPGVGDIAADLLLGVIDRDADLAADALLSASQDPGNVHYEELRRELSTLIGKYWGAALAEIRVGELVEDLLELVRAQHLALPSDLALLMATMAVLEGVGRDLDPSFDFVEVARPYADRMAREQLNPERVTRTVLRTARRLMRTTSQLPSALERALRRVGDGEFRVAMRPDGFERFLDRAEEMVDRLAFAILVAGFIVGFSRLLSVDGLPRWIQVLLFLGMLGALFVSAWMFISILLARWRGRRT